MNKTNKWQKSVISLARAQAWACNRKKIDSQDGKLYTFRASLGRDSLTFCGQAHAGSSNYHNPDPDTYHALNRAIMIMRDQIIDKAIELMEKDADKLAIEAEEELRSALKTVHEAKNRKPE